jgi:hypothetical protein
MMIPLGAVAASPSTDDDAEAEALEVELFQGMQDGVVETKIIVRNDHQARIFFTNKTKQPLAIQLPEAFAAVPALAQFGGAGGGGQGGGGFGGGGGGGQQSAGGGLGGGGGGGGGGVFSVPPEETERIDVAVLCLDHGLRDPSSSKPYVMVPADAHIDRPAVIALLTAFGHGQLHHGAAQAAVWNLNSDLSWAELSAKRQGTRRNFNRPPYFSPDEIRAGMAYAQQATLLAQSAGPSVKPKPAKPADEDASEAKSTEQDAETTPADDEEEAGESELGESDTDLQ